MKNGHVAVSVATAAAVVALLAVACASEELPSLAMLPVAASVTSAGPSSGDQSQLRTDATSDDAVSQPQVPVEHADTSESFIRPVDGSDQEEVSDDVETPAPRPTGDFLSHWPVEGSASCGSWFQYLAPEDAVWIGADGFAPDSVVEFVGEAASFQPPEGRLLDAPQLPAANADNEGAVQVMWTVPGAPSADEDSAPRIYAFQGTGVNEGGGIHTVSMLWPIVAYPGTAPCAQDDEAPTAFGDPVEIAVLNNDIEAYANTDTYLEDTFDEAYGGDFSADAATSVVTFQPEPGFTGIAFAHYWAHDSWGIRTRASIEIAVTLDCTIVGSADAAVIVGTDGDDVICVPDRPDDDAYNFSWGRGFTYVVDARGGDDIVLGGDGNDLIYGGEGADTIYGRGAKDAIVGGPGADTIHGGIWDDKIYSFDSEDTVIDVDGDELIDAPLIEVYWPGPFTKNDWVSADVSETILIDVLANDYDINGDIDASTLFVRWLPWGTAGAARGSDGGIVIAYTAPDRVPDEPPHEAPWIPDESGIDNFQYEICDARGACSNGQVFIRVNADESASSSPDSGPAPVGLGTADAHDGVLASGAHHACVLRTGGAVECWGENIDGESDAPSGSFTAVSAGLAHSCGLRRDGTVECWGNNDIFQADAPLGTFSTVAADGFHTCGIRTDGTIECWGANDEGQADPPPGNFAAVSVGLFHSCGLHSIGAVECWGENDEGQADAPGGDFAAVSSQYNSSCGLRTDGTVACWGGLFHVGPPRGLFAAVTAGLGHACGLRSDGAVECWGENDQGQADAPQGTFVAVSAGHEHSCGLHGDGDVTCWGLYGSYGEVAPVNAVAPPGTFLAASVGRFLSCAVRSDGSAECWGATQAAEAEPPPGPFSAVSAGTDFACGLRTNGTLSCWGDSGSAVLDATSGTFTVISAGDTHSCALRADGTAECWGEYDYQLNRPPPGPFTAISLGWWHACGLRPDGTAECWGNDVIGSTDPPEGTFADVYVTDYHSCGLRTEGTLQCWGSSYIPSPEFVRWL